MQPYTQRSTEAETASNSPPEHVVISITELELSRAGCRIVPTPEPAVGHTASVISVLIASLTSFTPRHELAGDLMEPRI